MAILMTQAYESGVVSRQQVDARESGPLAVGLEQHVALLGFQAPPGERGGELHEPEIARKAALATSEALDADDADRPRADPALAQQPCGDERRRLALQPFEVERAAQPDERRAASGAKPQARERGG
jgi:hypothetical protein